MKVVVISSKGEILNVLADGDHHLTPCVRTENGIESFVYVITHPRSKNHISVSFSKAEAKILIETWLQL